MTIIFLILIYLAIGTVVVYLNTDFMEGFLYGLKDTIMGDQEWMEKQIEVFKIENKESFYKGMDIGLTIFAYVFNVITWPRIVFLNFKIWIETFIKMMR